MRPERVFVLFNLLSGLGMGFIAPNYVPLVLGVGLTMPQVAPINAIFFLTIVLLELPTGMLADGRSRAWSVWVGSFVTAVFHLAYAWVVGFWSALVCEIMAGVAMSFISGALTAWVTDATDSGQDEVRLQKILSNGLTWCSVGVLTGGVIGGLCGAVDPRWGFWIGGGFQLLAFLVSWYGMDNRGEPLQRSGELEALSQSLLVLGRSRNLIWAALVVASTGLVGSFNHYWPPFFISRSGAVSLSLVWFVVYGGCALGAWLVRYCVFCRGRESLAVVGAVGLAGAALAVIPHLPGLVWPLSVALLHELGRGAFRLLLDAFVQWRVKSSYRATYGSLQSLVERLGFAVVLGVTWLLTRYLPDGEGLISLTWTVQGVILAVIALLLAVFRPRSQS